MCMWLRVSMAHGVLSELCLLTGVPRQVSNRKPTGTRSNGPDRAPRPSLPCGTRIHLQGASSPALGLAGASHMPLGLRAGQAGAGGFPPHMPCNGLRPGPNAKGTSRLPFQSTCFCGPRRQSQPHANSQAPGWRVSLQGLAHLCEEATEAGGIPELDQSRCQVEVGQEPVAG